MLRAQKMEKLQASYGESVTLIKGQEARHVVQNHPCKSQKKKLDIPEEIHRKHLIRYKDPQQCG